MTEEASVQYGYETDEVKVSPFNFGLNAGKTFLKKFEWIPNGGKEGAEQEALEIVLEVNGIEKGYRLFPVTKAFLKAGGETTDRNAPEFKEEVKNLNAKIFHVAHCFVERDKYEIAIGSKRIGSFKEFCKLVANLLPKDFSTKPLDCFMQFQWQPSQGQTRTYLEFPKKMSYGKWLIPAQKGTWTKNVKEGADTTEREALWYTNENGDKHPFIRNGWFMNSNFAKQQSEEAEDEDNDGGKDKDTTDQNAAPAAETSW